MTPIEKIFVLATAVAWLVAITCEWRKYGD